VTIQPAGRVVRAQMVADQAANLTLQGAVVLAAERPRDRLPVDQLP